MIFISPSYLDKITSDYPNTFNKANHKCVVVSNGIDDYWVDACSKPLPKSKDKSKIVFIGRVNKTKRPEFAIEVIKQARLIQPEREFSIHFVGADKGELSSYLGVSFLPDWVHVRGKITSKPDLFTEYQTSLCLLVPSYQETFGLVYLEALSSGCPIVLCKGEGVSGLFEEHKDILEITSLDAKNVARMILEIDDFTFDRTCISHCYTWDNYAISLKQMMNEAVCL